MPNDFPHEIAVNIVKRNLVPLLTDYLEKLEFFENTLKKKLIPIFDSIEQEADQIQIAEQEAYDSHWPSDDLDFDPLDHAEIGFDEAVDYLVLSKNLKQGLINSFAVFLHHLFEQQVLDLNQWFKLHLPEEIVKETSVKKTSDKEPLVKKESKFIKDLTSIDYTTLDAWEKIDELRLLANTIKHTKRGSSKQLKAKRVDLFQRPGKKVGEGKEVLSETSGPFPLFGEGIYVEENDLWEYFQNVKAFWQELSENFRQL